MIHMLALFAVAVPVMLVLFFLVWVFSDGFSDWRGLFETLGMVIVVAVIVLGMVWGLSYLEWESQAKRQPQTAEAPAK